MALDTLGVVIPCYNERDWIRRSVEALHAAADTARWPVDVVIVDDGSEPETARIIGGLAAAGRARILRQPNAGRFAARLRGLHALDTEYVLLLDSRVLISPGSLVPLRQHLLEEPSSAWNAHVEVITHGNPYAAFMYGITKVGWRRYFRRPRLVRFGPHDFDAYPKGTGAFATRRDTLIAASTGFRSLYRDPRFASDDTKLLRNVASITPIGIDPAFTVDYYGRDSAARWLQQAFFRGTTFVDGYVPTRRRALVLLGVLAATAPAVTTVTVRRPALVAASALAGSVAAAGATKLSGGTSRESVAVGGLILPFLVVFGSGLVRGLVMAVRR